MLCYVWIVSDDALQVEYTKDVVRNVLYYGSGFPCPSRTHSKYFIIPVKWLKGLTVGRIWSKLVEIESGYEALLQIGWSCNCFVASWWTVDKIKVFCEPKAARGELDNVRTNTAFTYTLIFINLSLLLLPASQRHVRGKQRVTTALHPSVCSHVEFPTAGVFDGILCCGFSLRFDG